MLLQIPDDAQSRDLSQDFPSAQVGPIRCPHNVKRDPGKTFQRAATVADASVPISVTRTRGSPGFRATRTSAILDVNKLQAYVQAQYDQQVGIPSAS